MDPCVSDAVGFGKTGQAGAVSSSNHEAVEAIISEGDTGQEGALVNIFKAAVLAEVHRRVAALEYIGGQEACFDGRDESQDG